MQFLPFAHSHHFLAEASISARATSMLDHLLDVPFSSLISCALLGFFFIICFFALGGKAMQLRDARLADDVFLDAFRSSPHPLALLQNEESYDLAPLDDIYQAGSRQMAFHMTGISDFSNSDFIIRLRAAGKISPSQMDTVHAAMEGAIIEARSLLEKKLGGLDALLGTLPWLACAAPLLVWMEHSYRFSAQMSDSFKIAAAVPVILSLVGTILCKLWLQLLWIKMTCLTENMRSFAIELALIFDKSYVNHSEPIDRLPSIDSFRGSEIPSFNLPPTDAPVHGFVRA
jgi:hypothetical protein